MSDDPPIDLSCKGGVRTLAEVERLCRTARSQGFPDESTLIGTHGDVVLTTYRLALGFKTDSSAVNA